MINTQFSHSTGEDGPREAHWRQLLAGSVTTADKLAEHLPADTESIRRVARRYPFRINPYYLSLIGRPGDPLWRQAVPDLHEIDDEGVFVDDPLFEEPLSPVPNLIHRYPDRVVFLVSNRCALYCRHCMRKRKVGTPNQITEDTIREGLDYIRRTRSVRDVIVSGGDPLMLGNSEILNLLQAIRKIPHVEIIRIHTRVPCTLPQRITPELVRLLGRFHPLYLITHFNHPDEITHESAATCSQLADAGIPLGCQTVLLKHVNTDPAVMKRLMQKLLAIRVKPYYLHHPDLVKGTAHFRPSIREGLKIIDSLRGWTSGLCVPHYVIDLPGGGGKIPLIPEYIQSISDRHLVVRNHAGKRFEYPLD